MLVLITLGCFAAGAVIGLLGGLLGIGGGLIAIPAMALILGMPQQLAQGTALILILPTVLMAVRKYNQNSRIDWRVAAAGATTAVCFTFLGAHLALGADSVVLRRSFAGFLLVVGLFYTWQTYNMRAARKLAGVGHERQAPRLSPPIGAAIGCAAGLLGGFFGVGGAILVVPLMTTYFKYTQTTAQALALTMIIPGSTIALATYTWAGQADWSVGVPLALGSVLCVSQGVRLALRLPERRLRACFAAMVFATVLLMLV